MPGVGEPQPPETRLRVRVGLLDLREDSRREGVDTEAAGWYRTATWMWSGCKGTGSRLRCITSDSSRSLRDRSRSASSERS